MKSMTIHGIDAELDKKITEKANEFGLSQNKTIKTILSDSLLAKNKTAKREAFSDLFGKWTQTEKKEFDKRISDLEVINKADWKK